MAATEVRGLDVLIKIGSQVVGGQRNASLELSAESIDATCKTTGGWSKKLPGIKTWSSSCDGIYFLNDAGIAAVQTAFKNSQEAELEFLNKLKENVNIPVIGNGDIKSCYDAKRMMDETNCDAIMIGRGVLGNPWLIKECVDYIENGIEPSSVSVEDKINMIKHHIDLLRKTKCDKLALLEIRSHATWYLKGIKNSSYLRSEICKAKSIEELLNLIDVFEKEKPYL